MEQQKFDIEEQMLAYRDAVIACSVDNELSETELEIENEIIAEFAKLEAYADKLAQGLPEGMLPKDIELLRESNANMATRILELEAEVERLRWHYPERGELPNDCDDCQIQLKDGSYRICYIVIPSFVYEGEEMIIAYESEDIIRWRYIE